jgi:hypothetical protein
MPPIRISRSSCGKGEIKRVMESVRKDKMPLDQGAAFEALVKTAKA